MSDISFVVFPSFTRAAIWISRGVRWEQRVCSFIRKGEIISHAFLFNNFNVRCGVERQRAGFYFLYIGQDKFFLHYSLSFLRPPLRSFSRCFSSTSNAVLVCSRAIDFSLKSYSALTCAVISVIKHKFAGLPSHKYTDTEAFHPLYFPIFRNNPVRILYHIALQPFSAVLRSTSG